MRGLLEFVSLICLVLCLSSVALAADNRRISFTLKYTLTASEQSQDVQFTCALPQTIPGRQTVETLRYTPPATRQFEEAGVTYAQYVFPKPAATTDLSIGVDMVIHKYDLSVALANPELRRLETDPGVLVQYLAPEKYLERDDPTVVSLARRIQDPSPVEVVRKVMATVAAELKQSGYNAADRGAVETLKSREGDCTDYSDLFIALCRAKGIPARLCEGYVTTTVAENDTQKHDWVEVYFQDLGWVPFDPFHVDLKSAQFESLKPNYVLLSNRRNDPTLGNFHFWYLVSKKGKASGADEYLILRQREE